MDEKENIIPAIRLMRDSEGESFFETGTIRTHVKIKSDQFWFANEIDSWQVGTHIAPRKQFVITLSGKLKFTTSDEKTFVIEHGEGHTWEMVEGHENWHRIYIPIVDEAASSFIKD